MFKTKNYNGFMSESTDLSTPHEKHFADGRNFYKFFWVFTTGALWGFLVETVWCLFRHGKLEWRTGLVYLPLNPVYGIGAVVLYLILYNMDRSRKIRIFATGVVAGSFVEYFCSFAQERAFGSVSWDYSNYTFNIGSRICLKYSIFWGLLALAWVALVGPFIENPISKIPSSIGKPLTWILFAVLVFFILLSAVAVSRWVMRSEGVVASTILEGFFDRHFPDERMLIFYPNMKFLH